jgi:ribonucleoside-diphosphate reductase alpha chain
MIKISVKKRNGNRETLDIEKIHKVLEWATQDLPNTSISDIEMKSHIQLYDNITTEQIHDILTKASEDLIKQEHNYQYVAARLALFHLRKKVFGEYDPIHIRDLVERNIQRGVYDPQLLNYYTHEEWERINSFMDHQRDYRLTIAAVKQAIDKYLVKDRTTGEIYETPQYAFMLIPCVMFRNYPTETRLNYIKEFYDAITKFQISLPTPILAGLRTSTKQFSSCVLIDVDDNLDSIGDAATAIMKYGAKRAGIGVNGGRIRAVKSRIRNGEVSHTGVTHYYRKFESSLKCCSQGGIRDAAMSLYVPVWHLEIEDIMVLKNNKGTPDNRVRKIDYGIQWDTYLIRRAIAKKTITLFSPHDVKDLYEAYFDRDRKRFEELYEKYEADPTIRKKQVNGRELLELFLRERQETARIYSFMADHVNTHSPFKLPVYQSNLCVEITLPTRPIRNAIDVKNNRIDFEGWIQLCTLAAVNLGTLRNLSDLEKRMNLLVRGLNEVLDYQDYPIPQAQIATMLFRPLGIGVINYAYWLAKQGMTYNDQEGFDATHRLAEAMYYYALKTSVDLAEERGAISGLNDTIYADGNLMIDNYCREVDNLVTVGLELDWDSLRERVKKFGVRNATLLALMPSESSSVMSNATNGVEPIRSLVTEKSNKNTSFVQVAPEATKLRNQYDYLWDMRPEHFDGYLKNMAIFQKFVCQSISTNTSYNPEHFVDDKISLQVLMNHFILAAKLGIKTLYYANTKGIDESSNEQEQFNSDEQESDDVNDCDACKI